MAAASSTPVYEALFNLYFVVAAAVGVAVTAWIVTALVRFRERPGEDAPDAPRAGVVAAERGHVVWIYAMTGGIAVILFGLVFGTIDAVNFIEHPPETGDALHVKVTALQFGWIFDYPEGFQTFGELRVPVGRVVILDVTSRDVWHNFAVPEYRIRIDAIPGQTNHLWFNATEAGTARILCAELCGVGHAAMKGSIVAVSPGEYAAWVDQMRPAAPSGNQTGGGS